MYGLNGQGPEVHHNIDRHRCKRDRVGPLVEILGDVVGFRGCHGVEDKLVVASSAVERIIAARCGDRVIAWPAGDRVRQRIADQDIVHRAANQILDGIQYRQIQAQIRRMNCLRSIQT